MVFGTAEIINERNSALKRVTELEIALRELLDALEPGAEAEPSYSKYRLAVQQARRAYNQEAGR